MTRIPCRRALITIAFILSGFFIQFNHEVMATEQIFKLDPATPKKISLVVGKSLVIESPNPVKRVSLAAPAFADAIVLTPRQVYLTGKASGVTNLTLWEGDTVLAAYDVEVSPDIVRLKEKLNEILPQETNIRVSSFNDTITLSGTVSSAANISKAIAVATPFGRIVNLLEVGGVQQVMLEVRISEISRSLMRKLGVNFNYVSADQSHFGLSLLDNLTTLPAEAGGEIEVSSAINAIYGFVHNGASWTVFVDALKAQGLVSVLAEPTLITLSGQTASFNAGGEVPIPQAAGLGATSIIYKKFGVGLSFTPTVLSEGKISMLVSPSVSELDFSNAVQQAGFVIPAFSSRDVSTVIELADGQSFAIAGLLSEKVNEVVSKFPLLGDIPILGALFRSTAFQKNETELVVIVTPHLVKPLDMSKQTLPTDKFSDPGDFKFYLMGILSGDPKEKRPAAAVNKKGIDGEVGHIIP